jgi:hypothetical protein
MSSALDLGFVIVAQIQLGLPLHYRRTSTTLAERNNVFVPRCIYVPLSFTRQKTPNVLKMCLRRKRLSSWLITSAAIRIYQIQVHRMKQWPF